MILGEMFPNGVITGRNYIPTMHSPDFVAENYTRRTILKGLSPAASTPERTRDDLDVNTMRWLPPNAGEYHMNHLVPWLRS